MCLHLYILYIRCLHGWVIEHESTCEGILKPHWCQALGKDSDVSFCNALRSCTAAKLSKPLEKESLESFF